MLRKTKIISSFEHATKTGVKEGRKKLTLACIGMASQNRQKLLTISLDTLGDDSSEAGFGVSWGRRTGHGKNRRVVAHFFAEKILDVALRWATHFSPSTTKILC